MQNNINTQLDEELAKLKAIGLKQISKNTKLASSKIEDLLEKRFDKIDKVRAKGFIGILEREYNVNLQEWISLQQQSQTQGIKSVSEVISKQDEEEYIKRLAQNAAIEQQKAKEREERKNELKNRETHVNDIALRSKPVDKTNVETYTWLYSLLVAILIVLMGYFAYKAFMQEHTENDINTTQISEDSNLAQDSYDGLFFDAAAIRESTPSVKEPQTQEDDMLELTDTQTPREAKNQFQNLSNTPNTQPDDILHIESEYELWLGVINLENGTKEQFSYKKQYDVKLSNKMLFIMGHSSFKLILNGKEIPHSSKQPVRMYYDGTTLSDVKYTQFKELNGGLEW